MDDIRSGLLAANLTKISSRSRVPYHNVDIIIDLQIPDELCPELSDVCSSFPELARWRSFTIACRAFPKYLSLDLLDTEGGHDLLGEAA